MVIAYEKIIRDHPNDEAILVQFYEDKDNKEPVWIPRSVIITVEESTNEIDVLESFVLEKGLEAFDIGY